jgi:uncharacterized protein (TIGR00290 family)
MIKQKAVMCWSGGKDATLALHRILGEGRLDVVALLTTVNAVYDRVSMHGLRRDLLLQQAESIGLPVHQVLVSEGSNSEYENKMIEALRKFKEEGVEKIIFGDIFLEDLRAYREAMMDKAGIGSEFPLWKNDTKRLANEFIALGYKALTCCVSSEKLDKRFAGREYDADFLASLPPDVDLCGENGEFHTFCYEGPLFKKKIHFKKGEIVFRPLSLSSDMQQNLGFWFADLL